MYGVSYLFITYDDLDLPLCKHNFVVGQRVEIADKRSMKSEEADADKLDDIWMVDAFHNVHLAIDLLASVLGKGTCMAGRGEAPQRCYVRIPSRTNLYFCLISDCHIQVYS